MNVHQKAGCTLLTAFSRGGRIANDSAPHTKKHHSKTRTDPQIRKEQDQQVKQTNRPTDRPTDTHWGLPPRRHSSSLVVSPPHPCLNVLAQQPPGRLASPLGRQPLSRAYRDRAARGPSGRPLAQMHHGYMTPLDPGSERNQPVVVMVPALLVVHMRLCRLGVAITGSIFAALGFEQRTHLPGARGRRPEAARVPAVLRLVDAAPREQSDEGEGHHAGVCGMHVANELCRGVAGVE
mmetsp:Transcript_34369/g.85180  ORF Transcript_34369/g.85180 Transcript_34369/m.85180 type:complete len:236 (+) Transcript_34369:1393-2100(+)